MKSYLSFTLTGGRLFPVWIIFYLFFIIPFYFLLDEFAILTDSVVPAGGPSKLFFLYLAIVISMAFIFTFYLSKLLLESIVYKNHKLVCVYDKPKYTWIIISGTILSLVTLGIYIPWFIRNIHEYFIGGASYKSDKFSFKGKGSNLFWTITLTFIFLFFFTGLFLFSILKSEDLRIYQVIITVCFFLNLSLVLKWMINFSYKSYLIKCTPELFPLAGKIALEIILGVVTFGIYFPLAYLRLYSYFVEHTKSNVVNGMQISMGYDGELISSFFFIWGQIILTAFTLGLYYPWAYCKIMQRVLNHTFLESDVMAL